MIIRSGQALTNEHCGTLIIATVNAHTHETTAYFVYQILRGMNDSVTLRVLWLIKFLQG